MGLSGSFRVLGRMETHSLPGTPSSYTWLRGSTPRVTCQYTKLTLLSTLASRSVSSLPSSALLIGMLISSALALVKKAVQVVLQQVYLAVRANGGIVAAIAKKVNAIIDGTINSSGAPILPS